MILYYLYTSSLYLNEFNTILAQESMDRYSQRMKNYYLYYYYYYYYYYSLVLDRLSFGQCTDNLASWKKQVPFRRAMGNVELMPECFSRTPEHGKSKYEIRQRRNWARVQEEKSEYGRSTVCTKQTEIQMI